MVDTFLAPAPANVLTPTPGHLADILHVELSTGDRSGTTYGTDQYGSWDYGGKTDWQRWDCDITSLRLVRGRQGMLERNSPGVCDFTAVQIVPSAWMTSPPTARPGRIVTADGRIVFYGVIEAAVLTKEYGYAEWNVTIVDDLARLGRLEVATLSRPVEDLGTRLDALLAAAGMLPISRNWGRFVQAVAGSDRKVLDEIGIAVDTWRWSLDDPGAVHLDSMASNIGSTALIDRTGTFVVVLATPPTITGNKYDNFWYPWRVSPTPSAAHAHNAKTWIGDPLNVAYSADVADVRNYLTYSNSGGTATVSQNVDSVAKYGPRSYQRMDLIGADNATGSVPASQAPEIWHTKTMNPTPALRVKTITLDCWNRPSGAVSLVDLLAQLDVTHICELALPDQDDDGGDIGVTPIPSDPFLGATTGHFIYGIGWDLADQQAMLTLSMDARILRTT